MKYVIIVAVWCENSCSQGHRSIWSGQKKTALFVQAKFISCYNKRQFSTLSPFLRHLSMLSPLPEEIKRYVSLSSHRYLTSPRVSVSADVFFIKIHKVQKKIPHIVYWPSVIQFQLPWNIFWIKYDNIFNYKANSILKTNENASSIINPG